MVQSTPPSPEALKAKVLSILGEHYSMAVATLRPDGWPQATIVGYAHDDLDLYFAVARTSQKLDNIKRDPRVSIAIGGNGGERRIRGLSMAAHAAELTDIRDVDRFNALLSERYPEHRLFSPSGVSVALLRASPDIISVVDDSDGQMRVEQFHVLRSTSLGVAPAHPQSHP